MWRGGDKKSKVGPSEQVANVGRGHPCKTWQQRNLVDGSKIQIGHLVKYCLKTRKVDLCPEALRRRKSKGQIEKTVKAHMPPEALSLCKLGKSPG